MPDPLFSITSSYLLTCTLFLTWKSSPKSAGKRCSNVRSDRRSENCRARNSYGYGRIGARAAMAGESNQGGQPILPPAVHRTPSVASFSINAWSLRPLICGSVAVSCSSPETPHRPSCRSRTLQFGQTPPRNAFSRLPGPRTSICRRSAAAAGRGPAPETRTIAQTSGPEPQTSQWPRSPARVPASGISSARTPANQYDASEGWSPVERHAPHRAGLARAGQPHHQGPVTAAQSKARRRTPQGDAELMTQKQLLDFKSPRRLEEVYNEHCERMQEREHRPRSCNDSTRRGDSQAGWNFRKAQVICTAHRADEIAQLGRDSRPANRFA